MTYMLLNYILTITAIAGDFSQMKMLRTCANIAVQFLTKHKRLTVKKENETAVAF